MTLTEFLLARIAEDWAVADMVRQDCQSDPLVFWGDFQADEPWRLTGTKRGSEIMMIDYSRVLAECEAKRRIVRQIVRDEAAPWAGRVGGEGILRKLALPYADHPDYDERWRV